MLSYAVTFLIIALLAGVLGFGVVAGTAAMIAKVCFVIFLVLFLVSLISGGTSRRLCCKNRPPGGGGTYRPDLTEIARRPAQSSFVGGVPSPRGVALRGEGTPPTP